MSKKGGKSANRVASTVLLFFRFFFFLGVALPFRLAEEKCASFPGWLNTNWPGFAFPRVPLLLLILVKTEGTAAIGLHSVPTNITE